MEKELTPNQQKKVNKGQNKIKAAVLQKQNLQKGDKPVPQSLKDKIDMSYNKLANLVHKYKFGKKSEYDGLQPPELARHQGYVGESILESLENLNVSEECFEDIVGLVEGLLNEDTENYIIKKYGDPEYVKNKKETHSYDLQFSRNNDDGRNEWDGNQWYVSQDFPVPKKASKSAQLLNKLKKAQFNELNQTEYARHRYNMDKVPEKEKDFVTNKIRNSNKNKEGDKATNERTYWARRKKGRSYQPPKSDEQRVADSRARHKAKQEKNKQK